jgi:hypothetical protein
MANPAPDFREELDVVAIDRLAFERQRARYANRGISFLALLNGVAALILLASLTQLSTQVEDASKVVGAMLVFGSGALAALGSIFFAYVRLLPRMQASDRIPVKSGLWWLSLLGVIAGATCFLVGLNMAGRAVTPELETKATLSAEPNQTTVRERKANKAVIKSLQQRLKERRNASDKAKKREQRKSSGEEPATKGSGSDAAAPAAPQTSTPAQPESGPVAPAPETAAPPEAEATTPPAAETAPPAVETPAAESPATAQPEENAEPSPQPLTRDKCKNWNEGANVCD